MTIRKSFGTATKLSIYLLLIGVTLVALLSFVSAGFSLSQHGNTPPVSPALRSSLNFAVSEQFNIEVIYAYVGRGPLETPHGHFNGSLMYPRSQYPSIVYFNLTHVANPENEVSDARMEVYHITIKTDTGCTENYTYVEATNYNPAFSDLNALSSHIGNLVNTENSRGPFGFFSFNLTANQSILGHKVGSIASYTSRPSELGLWSAGEPKNITIDIQRIGWVSVKESSASTFVEVEPRNILHVQLERYGDGFLYNTVVPQNKLPQIDLYHPPIQ